MWTCDWAYWQWVNPGHWWSQHHICIISCTLANYTRGKERQVSEKWKVAGTTCSTRSRSSEGLVQWTGEICLTQSVNVAGPTHTGAIDLKSQFASCRTDDMQRRCAAQPQTHEWGASSLIWSVNTQTGADWDVSEPHCPPCTWSLLRMWTTGLVSVA